jgi:hypothetical protein
MDTAGHSWWAIIIMRRMRVYIYLIAGLKGFLDLPGPNRG